LSINEPSDFDKLKEKLILHDENFVEPPLKRQRTEVTNIETQDRISFFRSSDNP